MLQPFSPPNTPPLLTPGFAPALNDGPVISWDKVCDALLMLVQETKVYGIDSRMGCS